MSRRLKSGERFVFVTFFLCGDSVTRSEQREGDLGIGGDEADTRSDASSTTMETTTTKKTTTATNNQRYGTLKDTEYEATFKMAETA